MKFITEFINRFKLKTPAFFQVIQWLSIATAVVAGIPALIGQFQTDLHITLPPLLVALSSKVVAWSAIVAWVIAKLPVSSPHSNSVQMKLPYTESK